MRIVISGTHASGKSTLVSDFALRHPEFVVLPDPFDVLDEALDTPTPAILGRQLRIAADRLHEGEDGELVIAERGPIDFLAYLLAIGRLHGQVVESEVLERALDITAAALERVDLLVILPLSARDLILVGAEEHPALREAMDEELQDLIEDPDVIGERTRVEVITGTPDARLAMLELLASPSAERR